MFGFVRKSVKQKDRLRFKHKPDYIFLIIILILLFVGLLMLASAGAPVGYQKFKDTYFFVKKQLFYGIIPGLIVGLFFYKVPYYFWKKWASFMLYISIVLLILVFVPGLSVKYGTAKSWIHIFGFSFQPSELVKLTFLIYLAAWIDSRGKDIIRNFYQGFLPFIFTLSIIMFLILMQPDMGTMLIIVAEVLVVYFVAGGNLVHFALIGISGAVLLYFLIISSPYRVNRFMTFLHPELDPLGIGYHINQAFLAIGTGGLFGRGYGNSIQKFRYLPEVTADSIFAVSAEELGFVFSLFLVSLFLLLFIRGLKIAKKTKDTFGQLLVIGIVSWFVIQAFVNIGAMVGLLPLTGVPLPFISAGGSSMLVNLASVGLILNISKNNP